MIYLNSVMLMGYLAADPESRHTPSGSHVVNFRMGLTKSWKDQQGQKHEKTTWITCVAWGPTADLAARFLKKGSAVHVSGELTVRSWDDKNGGGKRYATEVLVDRFQLLDRMESNQGRGDRENQASMGQGGSDFPPLPPGPDDDLPF